MISVSTTEDIDLYKLVEKHAIEMAGCSVDIWTKYYSDSSKEFWREKVKQLIEDVKQELVK